MSDKCTMAFVSHRGLTGVICEKKDGTINIYSHITADCASMDDAPGVWRRTIDAVLERESSFPDGEIFRMSYVLVCGGGHVSMGAKKRSV